MMTTQQIAEERQLIHYRTDGGVAIVELDDPPANTYSYEMMQQLDAAILRARMDAADCSLFAGAALSALDPMG